MAKGKFSERGFALPEEPAEVQQYYTCSRCGSSNVLVRRVFPPFGTCRDCEEDLDLVVSYGTEEDLV